MNRLLSRFKKKLIWQIVPVLLIVLIPAFCIGGYMAYNRVLDLCLTEEQESLKNTATYIEYQIKSNQNWEWLFSYWSDNAESVNDGITYDSSEALASLRKEFASINPEYANRDISPDELCKLDDNSIRLYAQICILENTLVFDEMKELYNLKFIYLSKILSEDDSLFLICGLRDGETRGDGASDIYLLGKHTNPGLEYHPVLEEIVTSHTEIDQLEKKLKEGRTGLDYNVYLPIFTSDGSTYVLCCCKSAGSVLGKVYHATEIIFIAFLSILVLGVLLMIIAFRKVLLNPLLLVQSQIREFTENKKSDDLVKALSVIKNENEIGELSSDVSTLATELTRYTEEVSQLTAANERIETELMVARKIQSAALPSALPEFEKHKNFTVYGYMNPAKEVGGDFFDYFKIDENRLGLVIGDVSGKGIPAAMFMMLSHFCIKNMASTALDPAQIFERINNVLLERNDMEMFVTSWFGILDLRDGIITCVNAGHENPAVYRSGAGFELIKTKHGFVLAGIEDSKYTSETIKLNKGDAIFLYTDGVTEATNSQDKMYGTTKMLDVLNRVSNDTCEDIITSVKSDIDDFVDGAPQFDDITMVCLKYMG